MVAELIFRWETQVVPPLPKGNIPRARGWVNQNEITKTRARLGICGGARVAIVVPGFQSSDSGLAGN